MSEILNKKKKKKKKKKGKKRLQRDALLDDFIFCR